MLRALTAALLVFTVQSLPHAAQISGNGDGGPATLARLDYVSAVKVDTAGNLFIVEPNTSRIRTVDGRMGIVETIAGGTRGSGGDGGPASGAEFLNPQDVAIGADGSVYVADMSNSRIRKVSQNGLVTTVAAIPNPFALDVDAGGSVYAALLGNRVTKLTGRTSVTVAGTELGLRRRRRSGARGAIQHAAWRWCCGWRVRQRLYCGQQQSSHSPSDLGRYGDNSSG